LSEPEVFSGLDFFCFSGFNAGGAFFSTFGSAFFAAFGSAFFS